MALLNRKPMARGKGFQRPALERKPLPAPVPIRGGQVTRADDMGTTQPKRVYIRSPALLAAVRTLPCQHTGETGSTEPAHSNWAHHGKGRGIKADDNRVAALSREIHRELDQGKKWSMEQRQNIWWEAHQKTVRALLAAGLWPINVPIPDIRNFQ